MTSVVYCKEAKSLLEALSETIRELVRLHEDQFLAVVSGDVDSQRFDDLIHMASERKNSAKYAYLHHLEMHRCSKISDGTNE